MEMPKNRIGYEGEEVDIESYISNKASGSDLGRCMVDTKYVNGASILLSVDGSGSMFGTNDRMKQVRNLTATIFDSIKGVDNINFKVLVWSSNSRGVMKVTEIKSKEDTSKMTMDIDGYCFTPTHLAIDHSSRVLNSMKGRNKLLMVVTDGRAQYYCNGDYTQLRLKRLGIKAVNNALRRNPNLIGLLVSNSGVSYCEDVFGKRFINATNMDEGNGVILKEFRQLVKRSL